MNPAFHQRFVISVVPCSIYDLRGKPRHHHHSDSVMWLGRSDMAANQLIANAVLGVTLPISLLPISSSDLEIYTVEVIIFDFIVK